MFESALKSSMVSIDGFVIDHDTLFEPKSGLNVIYGKNGVGKSTVINFIEAICARPVTLTGRHETQESPRSENRVVRSDAERGIGRVVVTFTGPAFVSLANDLAREIRNSEGRARIRIPVNWKGAHSVMDVAQYLTKTSSGKTKWTDERVYEAIAKAMDETSAKVASAIEINPRNTATKEEIFCHLWWDLTKRILQKELNPTYVDDLSEALRETIHFHYTEWSPESAWVQSINERLSTYGIEESLELETHTLSSEDVKGLAFRQLFLLFIDVVICRLQYELNDMELDFETWGEDEVDLPTEFSEDNPLTYSKVRDDADEIIGILVRAIYEQRSFLKISYARHEGPVHARALRLLFPEVGSEGTGEHTAAFFSLWKKWTENDEGAPSLPQLVEKMWLIDSSVLGYEKLDFGTIHTDGLPFYELQFALGKTDKVPFSVFRIDEDLDIPRVVSAVSALTIDKEMFEALALFDENVENPGEQLSSFVKPLNDAFEPVSDFVSSLGIGILGIRAEVSTQISDWVVGEGVELRFETPTWETSFARLSTAQQFWVRAGIWLAAAQNAQSRVLVLADEPDRSLHERAAYNVMEALSSSNLDVIVSSHSVAALRMRNAALHHLEVGPDRRRTISEVAVGNDVLVAAERLGTTPYDLLSLKRLMVLVEGAHDETVISRLLSLSDNKLLSDRVLIAAMRGVKNVVTAADSVLLTEFSELNLLVVVDNGRNDVFGPILTELRELDASGASEKELKRILTAHRKGRDASFEERMLFDLLERAIHRGVLRRLDLFALSVGDVIELLPTGGFGSSLSWEELRGQYQRSGFRTDFKDWLRETQQISVSVRTIEEAFDNSDSVHPELTRLLQQIELGCSMG